MALQKYVPSSDIPSVKMKSLGFSTKVQAQLANAETDDSEARAVDVDLREVYFLIMHFLSTGPCKRTYGQFWNELLENQLLPRRYHAWYSRSGEHSGQENDDGMSFPLSYAQLVQRSFDDGTCRIWDARNAEVRPRIYVLKPSDSLAGKNNSSSSTSVQQSHQIFVVLQC